MSLPFAQTVKGVTISYYCSVSKEFYSVTEKRLKFTDTEWFTPFTVAVYTWRIEISKYRFFLNLVLVFKHSGGDLYSRLLNYLAIWYLHHTTYTATLLQRLPPHTRCLLETLCHSFLCPCCQGASLHPSPAENASTLSQSSPNESRQPISACTEPTAQTIRPNVKRQRKDANLPYQWNPTEIMWW